jgi:hypothetical protein
MPPVTRIVLGFVLAAGMLAVGWWFWHNYQHIGPEALEPVVLAVGSVAILSLAGYGVAALAKGVKLL